jgi:hypothetical protein
VALAILNALTHFPIRIENERVYCGTLADVITSIPLRSTNRIRVALYPIRLASVTVGRCQNGRLLAHSGGRATGVVE